MPDKGKQLYEALSANPKYKNIGKDYESFKEHFSNPENAAKLYSAVSSDPKFKNVGKDVNAFSDYFGFKKNVTSNRPVETPSSPASSSVAGPTSVTGFNFKGHEPFNGSHSFPSPTDTHGSKQPEPVAPPFESNLGLGVPTTGLGSSLTNAASFGDISNLPGRRTASEKQLDNAMSAYSGAQGADAAQEINQFSNNRPQEQVAIDTENVGNRGGYIANKLLQGVGSLAAGLLDLGLNVAKAHGLATDMAIGEYRKKYAPLVRENLKNAVGFNVDKGAEATYNSEFIASALGGLAQSVPAMASGYTGLLLQGFDFGMQAIQNADTKGVLDESTKTIYATGLGLVTSALEKVGLEKIMKGNTTILSRLIFDKALREATKKTGGKVTGDILEQYINDNIKGITGKFAKGGARAIESFMTEFTTGASQEVAAIASEDLINKTTGKSIFDTTKESQWNGFVNRVAYAGAQEGVGGFIMGPFFHEERKNKVKAAVAKVNAIDAQLDNPNLTPPAVEALTQSKIQIQDQIDKEAEVEQSEQAKLSPEALKRASELEEDLNKAEQALADPELAEESKPEIQARIDAMNKELETVLKTGTDSEAQIAKETRDAQAKFEKDNDQVTYEQKMAELDKRASKLTPKTDQGGIKVNDLVNYTDEKGNVTQVPVEAIDGENVTVGVNKDGIYEKVQVKASDVSPVATGVENQMTTPAMVELEKEFDSLGYKVTNDKEEGVQVRDKNTGEVIDPDNLPDEIIELAGKYEQAVQKIVPAVESKQNEQATPNTSTKEEVLPAPAVTGNENTDSQKATETGAETEDPSDEITKLEQERDTEIMKAVKPDIGVQFLTPKELVGSKNPVRNKHLHDEIKDRYKELKTILDCLHG